METRCGANRARGPLTFSARWTLPTRASSVRETGCARLLLGAQPQPHEMPLPLRFGVIFEGGAVVHDPAVVDEVHFPRLEGELGAQLRFGSDPVERIQRLDLCRCQRSAGFFLAHLDPIAQIAA